MKIFSSLLLAVCTLLALQTALATTVIPPTFEQLVSQAEAIFDGTVTDVTSQWTGEGAQRHIVTFVTFTVNEALKGETGKTYKMRIMGGTVGDQTMEVTDSPKFVAGDRDILFVENNGRQFVPLVGIMHGRFRVQKDERSGREVVADDHGGAVNDLAKLGTEDAAVHSADAGSEASLSTADFKAAIRAKLASVQ
ncbi:MAG: hypothetical protein ABIR71_00600 [Chthoniobacterales bacterium]